MSATDAPFGICSDIQRHVGLFLVVALVPLEPLGALVAHHRREPPPADRVDAGRLRGGASHHERRRRRTLRRARPIVARRLHPNRD